MDIKSAIFLYFVDVFNINLASVNRLNLYTRKIVTLDDIFSSIQLDDYDIEQKVWKLFQPSLSNEFLGNDLYRLASNYQLVQTPGCPIKTLVRK